MPAIRPALRRLRSSLPAILAVLIVVGIVTGVTVQLRSQQQARQEAELTAARFRFALELRDRRSALVEPARLASDAASTLRLALLEHVTASDRDLDTIADERQRAQERLTEAAEELRRGGELPLPDPPAVLDEEVVTPLLQEAAELQGQATLLADVLESAAADAERWAVAVAELSAANAAYARTATDAADAPPSDTAAVAARWQAELPALERYRAAAEAAAAVPGLEELAAAHARYATESRRWAEEAVALLQADERDAYNQRLAEFEGRELEQVLQREVAAATPAAAASPAIEAVAVARRRVLGLIQALERFRLRIPERLLPTTGTRSPPDGDR